MGTIRVFGLGVFGLGFDYARSGVWKFQEKEGTIIRRLRRLRRFLFRKRY
jgi:hypothetical protein